MMRVVGNTAIVLGVLLIVSGLQSVEITNVRADIERSAIEVQPASTRQAAIQYKFDGSEATGRASSEELPSIKNAAKSTSVELVSVEPEIEALLIVEPQPIAARPVVAKAEVEVGEEEPEFEIEWLEQTFTISHYTFALETDPLYVEDEKVKAPGLDENEKHRYGFLFGGRGVLQQGSGLTESGRYITIDWDRSYHDPEDFTQNRWYFKYGVGRPVVPWETVATHHPDLPQGTKIVIETYLGQYEFIVGDAGLDLADDQIDVFVGHMTIQEADQLGITWSRVGIVRPYGYSYWQEQKALEEQAQQSQPEEEGDSIDIAADQE
ncbi:MAG: hypothetical protein AAGD96_09045 [Chloroflexota bacterium]